MINKKKFLIIFAFLIASIGIGLFTWLNIIRAPYSKLNNIKIVQFNHSVKGISFDKQDNIWVSDSQKLYFYKDEKLLKKYTAPQGLGVGKEIISFDSEGRVWLVKHNGVAFLKNDKWVSVYPTENKIDEFGVNISALGIKISSFSLDPQGNAWVGITNEGIKVFDKTGKLITTYDIPNSNDYLMENIFDNNGVGWIRTDQGLSVFNGGEWKTYSIDFITDLALDNKNRIWGGTSSGVVMFNGKNWTNYESEDSFYVFTLVIDRLNRLWMIGSKPCQLCMFDGKVWKFYYPKYSNDVLNFDTPYTPYKEVRPDYFLSLDMEGNAWYATNGGAAMVSDNLPMFSLTEWKILSFADQGYFYFIFIGLLNLWFVTAAEFWKKIGITVAVGMLIHILWALYAVNLAFFTPGIFLMVGAVIGGVLGKAREKSGKIGAESAGIAIGSVLAFIVWLLFWFFILYATSFV